LNYNNSRECFFYIESREYSLKNNSVTTFFAPDYNSKLTFPNPNTGLQSHLPFKNGYHYTFDVTFNGSAFDYKLKSQLRLECE